MRLIYESDIDILQMYLRAKKMNILGHDFQKFENYRQTDRCDGKITTGMSHLSLIKCNMKYLSYIF